MSTAKTSVDSPNWLGSHEPYGVSANSQTAETVFEEYERCGFLYPAKRERLSGIMPDVMGTWRSTLTPRSRDSFVHVHLHNEAANTGSYASLSIWRSTLGRVHSQHLISRGTSIGSRQVMLAAQDAVNAQAFQYAENWFRIENRFPAKVFGSVPGALGEDRAALSTRCVIAVSRSALLNSAPTQHISPVHNDMGHDASNILRSWTGQVIADAEELNIGDIELLELDAMYRDLGLSRTRNVFCAHEQTTSTPVGLCLAYTGPIGLNFSLLENRCDVWIDPKLPSMQRLTTALALIRASHGAYGSLKLPYLVVTTDPVTANALCESSAAALLCTYVRCVWTRQGFWDWYCHVDSFYRRILSLAERRRSRTDDSTPEESVS